MPITPTYASPVPAPMLPPLSTPTKATLVYDALPTPNGNGNGTGMSHGHGDGDGHSHSHIRLPSLSRAASSYPTAPIGIPAQSHGVSGGGGGNMAMATSMVITPSFIMVAPSVTTSVPRTPTSVVVAADASPAPIRGISVVPIHVPMPHKALPRPPPTDDPTTMAMMVTMNGGGGASPITSSGNWYTRHHYLMRPKFMLRVLVIWLTVLILLFIAFAVYTGDVSCNDVPRRIIIASDMIAAVLGGIQILILAVLTKLLARHQRDGVTLILSSTNDMRIEIQ